MNLTSVKYLILSLFLILFMGQFRDVENFSFYLSSSKIYSTNEESKIQVETYNYSGSIKFRAYKINNPVEYFENLSDPHHPDIKNLNTSNTFNILQSSYKKLKSDLKMTARNILPGETRKMLKNIFTKTDDEQPVQREKKAEDVPSALADYEIVKEWTENIPQNSDYWNYHTANVQIKEPGVYLLEGKVGNRKVAYTTLVISDYALVTKNSDKKLLAFVANKINGKAIPDFPLNFYMNSKLMSENLTTDKSGILTFEYPKEEKAQTTEDEFDNFSYTRYLIMGTQNNHFIISEPYISDYYSSYNKYNVYLYTERPVYRPGQSVYFKGIIREKGEDGSWQNFSQKYINLRVTDSRGSVVYRDSILTNDFGTINGNIKLEKEFPLGYYWIETKIENANYSSGFEVQEYKKPEYKVEIDFNKEYYVKGDELNAAIKANYYFGNPVSNANVEYYVYRNRYYSYYSDYYGSDDDFEGSYYGQEMIYSQTGSLDENGKLNFKYYTDNAAKYDYIYTIVANVTDESRRVISSSRSVKVMRGNFSIFANAEKYVYQKGEKVKIQVKTEDFKKNPVMTNFQIKVILNTYEKIEKNVNGIVQTDYKRNKSVLATLYGATGSEGEGEVFYEADRSGYLEIEVSAKDNRGNQINSTNYIYVADEKQSDWYSGGSNSIKIIPDKSSYEKDQTIKALVIAPYPNIDVLITLERDNIYYSTVEHFDGVSKVIEIPVKSYFSPNIYLSASLLSDNEFFSQTKEISVPDKEKLLNIAITYDKELYKPNETGKMFIKVTDQKMKPVKNAEISVGVVDESIYDIVKERTQEITKQFYSKSPNQVYSSSSLYFSFYGYSREIRKDEYSDLYEERKNPKMFASRNERERIAFGDIKGEKFSEPKVRRDFKDMILWNPVLITDGKGSAMTSVRYPDNLTTWRATARAVTKETQVGSGISKVITKKNLMVRLETPRFFISKDEAKIALTVHNYMKSDKTVDLSLTGSNIVILGNNQKVFIPKNGSVSVDFPVTTLDHIGNCKLLAKAVASGESDAAEITVPILPHGIERADVKNMQLSGGSGSKTTTYTINPDVNLYTSNLYFSVAPSMATSILNSLDDLIDYPYGCVEQTMSRFLPAIIVQNTIKELGAPLTDRMKNELPSIIEKSLKRLYSFQHGNDGGWGWWKDDQTDPYMTAYVIYGLSLAANAGISIDNSSLEKGMWNIKWWIENNKTLDFTSRTFLIYALTLANKNERIFDPELIKNYARNVDISKSNNYSKALLALIFNELGASSEANNYVNQLSNSATYYENMVYWKGKSWHYNWQDDEIETTAFAVKALLSMSNKDSKIEKAINYLMNKKSGNSWNSTKQTAMIILALIDYMKQSAEMNTNYTLKVFVNDRLAFESKITKDNIFTPMPKYSIDHKYLRNGVNKVRIEKSGEGKLFFTGRLLYFTTEEDIAASGSDFIVQRDYYKLRLQRNGNNLSYIKEPVASEINSGDLIFVKIKVKSNIENEYFMLEDPIAAGYEPVLGKQDFPINDEKSYDYEYGYWNWLYSAKEFRDQKVTFFSKNIYKGEYSFSYIIRAQIPGDFHIMPAQAYLMYYPEMRGNSAEKTIRIN